MLYKYSINITIRFIHQLNIPFPFESIGFIHFVCSSLIRNRFLRIQLNTLHYKPNRMQTYTIRQS